MLQGQWQDATRRMDTACTCGEGTRVPPGLRMRATELPLLVLVGLHRWTSTMTRRTCTLDHVTRTSRLSDGCPARTQSTLAPFSSFSIHPSTIHNPPFCITFFQERPGRSNESTCALERSTSANSSQTTSESPPSEHHQHSEDNANASCTHLVPHIARTSRTPTRAICDIFNDISLPRAHSKRHQHCRRPRHPSLPPTAPHTPWISTRHTTTT
jgi:hypothetical protein